MYQLLWMVGEKRKQMHTLDQKKDLQISTCPVLHSTIGPVKSRRVKANKEQGKVQTVVGAAEHGEDAVTLV